MNPWPAELRLAVFVLAAGFTIIMTIAKLSGFAGPHIPWFIALGPFLVPSVVEYCFSGYIALLEVLEERE